jgi:hypothetical protein
MKRISLPFILGLAILVLAVPATSDVTKIAPSEAEPGEPFTLIDTDRGRLIGGSAALFFPVLGGGPIEVSLRTHRPFKTAHGRLPVAIPGGDYNVSVRQPNGTVIAIGPFHVIGAVPQEPTIQPTSGPWGTAFTITDPQGRIQPGDIAVFYPEGESPPFGENVGAFANDVVVSADGATLAGNVPFPTCANRQNFVSVRSALRDPRFGDLGFFVTFETPHASIQPNCGSVSTQFTITDPFGRMIPGDVVIFTAPDGSDFLSPTQSVSGDGTILTGRVGVGTADLPYNVTVRHSVGEDPLFQPLLFIVVAGF